MKILHISRGYHDGFGYQENLLPRYQAALGHDVVLVTSVHGSGLLRPKGAAAIGPGEYLDEGVRIVRLAVKMEYNDRFIVLEGLAGVLEREKPDYIFHHGVSEYALITAAEYKRRHPSVFLAADSHADYDNTATNRLWRLAYYRTFWTGIVGRLKGRLDVVFGVSPERCVFAENEFGVPGGLVRLLPIGADVDGVEKVFCGAPRAGHDGFRLVTGGRWFRGKGLEEMIAAVKDLDLRFDIFGMLSDDATRDLVASAGANVFFHGWQDRKGTLSLLRNADAAIWSRRHTTMAEDAIALGTPILLKAYGSTSHMIRGNGVYLQGCGVDEIRRVLERLAASPGLVEGMRAGAVEMRDLLSYRRIAAESIEYYHDRSPQEIHRRIMDDPFCRVEVPPLLPFRRS